MNIVAISGRLTRDPELRTLPSGTAVANCGVCVVDRKKVDDEWVDVPNFVDITYFGRRAELFAQKADKGDTVTVHGKLHFSSWEAQDGTKRSKLEVTANDIEGEFVFRPSDYAGNPSSSTPAESSAQTSTDDIPF